MNSQNTRCAFAAAASAPLLFFLQQKKILLKTKTIFFCFFYILFGSYFVIGRCISSSQRERKDTSSEAHCGGTKAYRTLSEEEEGGKRGKGIGGWRGEGGGLVANG